MQKTNKRILFWCVAALVFSMLAVSPAKAVPNLQVYIPGGEYDEARETWLTSADDFEMWVVGARREISGVKFALGVPEDEQGSINVAWHEPGQADYGQSTVSSLSMDAINGIAYEDYWNSYYDGQVPDPQTYGYAESGIPLKGDGSSLPPGGIFPTQFYEYYIGDFNTENEVENYIPGDEGTAQGQIKKFSIEVLGYSWIDMVAYNHVLEGNPMGRYVFSPYSHTGAKEVPEPGTLLLTGSGLIFLGFMFRKKLLGKHLNNKSSKDNEVA